MIVYAIYCDTDSDWYEDMDDDEIRAEILQHFSATVARTHGSAAMLARNLRYSFNETHENYDDWTITPFEIERLPF